MITLELFEMKLMRTLKWLIVILIIQMRCRMSLMRNHEALSLGRSYPDTDVYQIKPIIDNYIGNYSINYTIKRRILT